MSPARIFWTHPSRFVRNLFPKTQKPSISPCNAREASFAAAALVEVAIPQELGEGIELPGPGLTIELAGAPEERASSVIDQSIGFLPNVATDTDLAVAPTPTGVETLTQLRSSDAPHVETFITLTSRQERPCKPPKTAVPS